MTIQAAQAPPDLSIRARAPSPKRLSRKVLLAGALAAGGIIAWALVAGLSDQHRQGPTSEASPVGATIGPPESIAQASSDYDPAALQPPRDMLWGNHPPAASSGDAHDERAAPVKSDWPNTPPAPAGTSGASAPPDPEAMARGAPIIFSARGARESFAASQRGAGDDRLPTKLNPPRSPYELLAGAVIPAALLTELNSDLPGRVIAQVTAPVFDSVAGEHLLIPQGARLIGTYESAAHHGDNRILLAWNRIVMPNGWSIDLKGMEATDPSGAAGLSDRTDDHLGPLAGAIGLSAVISVIANNAEDRNAGPNLVQGVGDAAAQEAARTGGRIVERQLQVHPTLRVRAGAPVRVLATRDIGLKPYQQATQ